MKNVFLGEYVKQRRLDLGLTQEQLCDGICEPMTLSRLENGKQTPSRNRINALLQRLGLPDDRYFALLSKNELEMEALQKEIVACNVTEKVPEGFEKLAQFEKLADPDDQNCAAICPAFKGTSGTLRWTLHAAGTNRSANAGNSADCAPL